MKAVSFTNILGSTSSEIFGLKNISKMNLPRKVSYKSKCQNQKVRRTYKNSNPYLKPKTSYGRCLYGLCL